MIDSVWLPAGIELIIFEYLGFDLVQYIFFRKYVINVITNKSSSISTLMLGTLHIRVYKYYQRFLYSQLLQV